MVPVYIQSIDRLYNVIYEAIFEIHCTPDSNSFNLNITPEFCITALTM